MNGTRWEEKRFYIEGAPDGMCWSVRQMFSYSTLIERFIPHLQEMAEGLERAHFETYDYDPQQGDFDNEDNYGIFVIGLRPRTADDKTTAERRAEAREREERARLAELRAKYPEDAA